MIATISARQVNLAVAAVAAVAAVSVGVAAARVTWHALGDTGGEADTFIASAYGAEVPTPVDLAPILALAPFGTRAPDLAGEPTRETSLGLVLRGVVLSVPPSASTALIAANGGELKAYGVGEAISGGAVLDAVFADHVVLLVGAARETLSFPKAAPGADVAANRNAILTGQTTLKLPPATATSEAAIETYRRQIAANPQAVLDGLGIDATPDGYRIGTAPSAGVRRAGFLPGDVVTRVNGVRVGDVESDRQLFDQVAVAGQARIEVMRGARPIIMSFPLQ